jgi:hypothetical protein
VELAHPPPTAPVMRSRDILQYVFTRKQRSATGQLVGSIDLDADSTPTSSGLDVAIATHRRSLAMPYFRAEHHAIHSKLLLELTLPNDSPRSIPRSNLTGIVRGWQRARRRERYFSFQSKRPGKYSEDSRRMPCQTILRDSRTGR